jgi:hypothetical protein
VALVSLPFAGGHETGEVDAHGDGPGHRPALAVLGGGVADVGERSGPRDRREDQDRRGVSEPCGDPAKVHREASLRSVSGMGG